VFEIQLHAFLFTLAYKLYHSSLLEHTIGYRFGYVVIFISKDLHLHQVYFSQTSYKPFLVAVFFYFQVSSYVDIGRHIVKNIYLLSIYLSDKKRSEVFWSGFCPCQMITTSPPPRTNSRFSRFWFSFS
jgi:hypothetical protein